ncbi:hypothetical protein D3C81_1896600 [compost metagenome]
MLQPGKHIRERCALLFIKSCEQIGNKTVFLFPVRAYFIPALRSQRDQSHSVVIGIVAPGDHTVLLQSLQVAGDSRSIDIHMLLQGNLADLSNLEQLMKQAETGGTNARTALEGWRNCFVQRLQTFKDAVFLRQMFCQN